jgi:protein-S-isoprenylcysteine O-methyltransferase Ste14
MAPLFFSIYFLWIIWLLSWILASPWTNPTIKRGSLWREILFSAITVVGVALLFGFYSSSFDITFRFWRPPAGALGWTMMMLVAFGLSLCWWARICLGRLWSGAIVRKNDHRIVEDGPYALVRHPIYAGFIIAAFATAAVYGTPTSFLGAGIITVGRYLKAREEERFLREELGEAYDSYARRVPMLVPFWPWLKPRAK